MPRFSEYFGLNRAQVELDFVDIPLDADIRLYVDPYALAIGTAPWFVECSNLVVMFFQKVIDALRSDRDDIARDLLGHLQEPNETRLGLSSGKPRGRGVGPGQSDDLLESLRQSRAVRTGHLHDLEDCELLVPGISNDKISDVTINIIRSKLAEYTANQCAIFDIPLSNVNAGLFWNSETGDWVSHYAPLPLYEGQAILLVPKVAVRRRLLLNQETYYNKYVLEYFRSQYLSAEHPAHRSLLKVLKNGKRVIYKKDVEKLHPQSKGLLVDVSSAHPELLQAYKASAKVSVEPIAVVEIELTQPRPRPGHPGDQVEGDIEELINRLAGIPPGNAAAHDYHKCIISILTALFYPALHNAVKEQEINEGRKRVDIVFDNSEHPGFFRQLSTLHGIKCPWIFVECKNYSADLENEQLDQLAGRLDRFHGRFGIMVCRHNEALDLLSRRCRDLRNDDKFIIVLDDTDINEMLRLKADGNDAGIQAVLGRKLRELMM